MGPRAARAPQGQLPLFTRSLFILSHGDAQMSQLSMWKKLGSTVDQQFSYFGEQNDWGQGGKGL